MGCEFVEEGFEEGFIEDIVSLFEGHGVGVASGGESKDEDGVNLEIGLRFFEDLFGVIEGVG